MFLYQASLYASQNSLTEKLQIIAVEDSVNSFISSHWDKYHFASQGEKQYLGVDFQIVTTILKELKIDYEIKIVPSDYDIELQLKSGEADIALGVRKDKKSLNYADFIKTPMRKKNFVFYGRAKEVEKETLSYEDILKHNYIVGIRMGAIYPPDFWKAFPFENETLNFHLKEGASYSENILRLKNKKIDFFVGDKSLLDIRIKKSGEDKNIFAYRNILYSKNFYCVFSKNSKFKKIDELKLGIQKIMYRMQEANKLEELNNYWLNNLL